MLGALEGAAPDPNDPATQHVHAAAGPRLHEVPQARRPQGRAHRHPARVLLRARRTPPGPTTEPRGGLNDDQKKAMDEAIAVLEAAGRDHRRSGRHPERRRQGSEEQLHAAGTSAPAWTNAKGKDEDCSVDFKYGMKRDFNTWLDVARRRGAGEVADRAARSGTPRTRRRARSSTASRNLDISDEMDLEADRARYEADRAKDIRLGGTHGIDEVMKAERLDALLFPGARRRRHRRAARLSDGDRAVRARAECADAARSRPASTRSRRRSASASPAWRAASRS